ncbi:MAG: amidohydrolase [Colwellia sp.]
MGKLVLLLITLCCAVSELKAKDISPVEVQPKYTIIKNAVIYNGGAEQTYTAMVIDKDRVAELGTTQQLRAKYPDAHQIDMQGQAILPGFVDSHIHPFLALERTTCSLDEGNNLKLAGIIETVKACIKGRKISTNWITVNNYNGYGAESEAFLAGYKSIAAGLNEISAVKPIILIGLDGHAYAVNQFALDNPSGKFPLNKQTLSTEYSNYQKLVGQAPDGSLTGVIKSQAAWDLFAYDTSTAEDFANNPDWLNKYLLSNGITSAHETFAQQREIDGYYKLATSNHLIPRIFLSIAFNKDDFDNADPEGSVDRFINKVLAHQQRFKDLRAEIIGIKIMVDGVIEFPLQTAAMLEPYLNAKIATNGDLHYGQQDENHKGVLELDQKTLNLLVRKAAMQNLRVHFHAIGDGAVEAAIRSVESAEEISNKGLVHTISHLQQVTKQQVSDMARLKISASFTPSWAVPWKEYDVSVIPYFTTVSNIKKLDELYQSDSHYMKKLYPINSMVKAGITVAFGSDAPVDSKSPRPFSNMIAAISRSALVDVETEQRRVVFNKAEQIDLNVSLNGFMKASAESIGNDKIGSLQPGSYADFIVLNYDWVKAVKGALADNQYQKLDTLCDKSVNDACSAQVIETWVGGIPQWKLSTNE